MSLKKKTKLEPAMIWKLVSGQRITKKYSTSMGGHLSLRYGQVILVSGYPVLTAVNWSQHWCTICVQYQFSCAPRLARKCEIERWYACGTDGRSFVRCTVTWLPNFLGWVDLLTHGAPRELRYKNRELWGLSAEVQEKVCRGISKLFTFL